MSRSSLVEVSFLCWSLVYAPFRFSRFVGIVILYKYQEYAEKMQNRCYKTYFLSINICIYAGKVVLL